MKRILRGTFVQIIFKWQTIIVAFASKSLCLFLNSQSIMLSTQDRGHLGVAFVVFLSPSCLAALYSTSFDKNIFFAHALSLENSLFVTCSITFFYPIIFSCVVAKIKSWFNFPSSFHTQQIRNRGERNGLQAFVIRGRFEGRTFSGSESHAARLIVEVHNQQSDGSYIHAEIIIIIKKRLVSQILATLYHWTGVNTERLTSQLCLNATN